MASGVLGLVLGRCCAEHSLLQIIPKQTCTKAIKDSNKILRVHNCFNGSLAATLPSQTKKERARPRDLRPRVWVYPVSV